MNYVTLGLGFGDEGKGLITDHLCHQNSIVVRFSGGHQAGHTVVREGKRHVFSNFGSGTLKGCKTFWSKYCTFLPAGVVNEYMALNDYSPIIFVDYLSPVTTFYDIFYNRALEKLNQHGSCGVGFAATIERNETPYKLYVQDLLFPEIFKQKLAAISLYYENKLDKINNEKLCYLYNENDFKLEEKNFLNDVSMCLKIITPISEKSFFNLFRQSHFVFEGSQGILLDMDFGFFPNVTRSNTTSKNALEIINRNDLQSPEIYYITRSYQTRHGNGWMSDEGFEIKNPLETNVQHDWQGNFRTGNLDISLINYALICDDNFSQGLEKNIAVTCLDQNNIDVNKLCYNINQNGHNFKKVIKSYSDCSDNINQIITRAY